MNTLQKVKQELEHWDWMRKHSVPSIRDESIKRYDELKNKFDKLEA